MVFIPAEGAESIAENTREEDNGQARAYDVGYGGTTERWISPGSSCYEWGGGGGGVKVAGYLCHILFKLPSRDTIVIRAVCVREDKESGYP